MITDPLGVQHSLSSFCNPLPLATFATSSYPSLKLTYFPLAAREEAARLAFHIGGVPFVDERITFEEFGRRQPTLPVLEVDGKVIAQAHAVLRYVGNRSGLYPTVNVIVALQIDELFCLMDALYNMLGLANHATDPARQVATFAELEGETIPKFLNQLDKRTAHYSSGPYAIGARLTVADLAIAGLVNFLASGAIAAVPTTIVDPFANILKIRDLVHAHPKVVEWQQTHADH